MVATSSIKSKHSEQVTDTRLNVGVKDADLWLDPLKTADISEEWTCLKLAKLLEHCLSQCKKTTLQCSTLLVPEKLTHRVSSEVLRQASCEPCGLRGCVLHVLLEQGETCKRLERIVCDPSVVPTFELTLVLRQDGTGWPSLRDFLFLKTCFSPKLRNALRLSPSFRLVKRKLYSPSDGAVVEC
ncbi:DNA damage-inducible transcript 4-like protein [Neosynchiropus ocellatus]